VFIYYAKRMPARMMLRALFMITAITSHHIIAARYRSLRLSPLHADAAIAAVTLMIRRQIAFAAFAFAPSLSLILLLRCHCCFSPAACCCLISMLLPAVHIKIALICRHIIADVTPC